MHVNAAPGQRERDSVGADPELERSAVARFSGEEIDRRPDDARGEHVRVRLVVVLGDALAEEILRCGQGCFLHAGLLCSRETNHAARLSCEPYCLSRPRTVAKVVGLFLLAFGLNFWFA